ncbi:hypothetical protein L7F22_053243 [Adiantum nelumboides]|nr:hypothetical protein [Adiantum nelumboides]
MANASFPVFTGKQGEDAADFLDNLEIACVVSGRDDDTLRERIFPLLMKMEARSWYNALPQAIKGEWPLLQARFEQRFGRGVTSKHLWQLLTNLKQDGLHEYASYESKFVDLWGRWVASLRQGDVALDFLKKDRFIAGLWPPLKEKVRGRFPETYDLAVEVACLKDKKLRLQNHSVDPSEGEDALCKDDFEAMELESQCSTLLESNLSLQEWCGASQVSLARQTVELDDAEKDDLNNLDIDEQQSEGEDSNENEDDDNVDIMDDREVKEATDFDHAEGGDNAKEVIPVVDVDCEEDNVETNEEQGLGYESARGDDGTPQNIVAAEKDEENKIEDEGDMSQATQRVLPTIDEETPFHKGDAMSTQEVVEHESDFVAQKPSNDMNKGSENMLPTIGETQIHEGNTRNSEEKMVVVENQNDVQTSPKPSDDMIIKDTYNMPLRDEEVKGSEKKNEANEEHQGALATMEVQDKVDKGKGKATRNANKAQSIQGRVQGTEGGANDDTPMLVNYLVTRLQQAMANPARQGLSTAREGENQYEELQNVLLDGSHPSKRRGHAQRQQESSSKEKGRRKSPDESMEEVVAPRRRRAQRSPTPTKRKRSPHSPPDRKSKKEEKDSKKKKERKRSPSSPSSSPSSSSDESGGYSSRESPRRGHRRSHATWRRSNKLKKFKEGGKSISFLTYDGTFGATDKVLAFIQQFDAAFGDEGFTESSKLRHVAMHFQKSARQWLIGLCMVPNWN